MTVKELITELLNYNMETEIYLVTKKFHIDEYGNDCNGYSFKIDKVDTFGPDVELLFTDYRDDNQISYDEEMVSSWMDELKSNNQDIDEAIDEAKVAISNERIWKNGSSKLEQINGHEQNIANLVEYIRRLKELE